MLFICISIVTSTELGDLLLLLCIYKKTGKYLVNKTATGNRSGAGREVVLNCLGPLSTVIEQTGILGSFLMVIEGEESPV